MHLDGLQRALVDSLDGLVILDPEGHIEIANRTLQTLLGYTEAELRGRSEADVFGQSIATFTSSADTVPDSRDRSRVTQVRTRSGDTLRVRLNRDALPQGRAMIVVKPVANAELDTLRRQTDETKSRYETLERERDFLRGQLARARGYGPIVGSSAAINLLHAQVAAISKTDSPVLISGESGVGKRLTGYSVHLARHPERPLVEMDFREVPEDFQTAMLFDERLPVAQAEDGKSGTMMLVGIEAMGIETQSRLLGRLDTLDTSIVATTTVDLRAEVQEGRFLEELYYRLGIHPLRVPPLRRRPHDIALLASHFWGDAISETVGMALAEQTWPGNVRELRTRIARAKILARKRGSETLSLDLLGLGGTSSISAEPARIRRVLREHSGNIQRTARALGMSRQALYRRIEKHGIER